MIANLMLAVLLASSSPQDADRVTQSKTDSAALAATPYFHNLSVADGLPSNRVYMYMRINNAGTV